MRIFLPHDMLLERSGVILGRWSADKSMACISRLENPDNFQKTDTLTPLGLWRNCYDGIEDFCANISLFPAGRFLKNSGQKWFVLEKKTAGLPECTLHEGRPSHSSTLVIVYDAQKLQQSYYLTDSAYMSCVENGTEGSFHERTNLQQLTYLLALSNKSADSCSSRCLTRRKNAKMHALGDMFGTLCFYFITLHSVVAKLLFENRYLVLDLNTEELLNSVRALLSVPDNNRLSFVSFCRFMRNSVVQKVMTIPSVVFQLSKKFQHISSELPHRNGSPQQRLRFAQHLFSRQEDKRVGLMGIFKI